MRNFESSLVFQDARVRVTGYTDTPKRFDVNEDAYLYIPSQGLALLADGSRSSRNARLAVEVGTGSVVRSLWGSWLEAKTYQRILRKTLVDASGEVGKKAPHSWTTLILAKLQVPREGGGVDAYVAGVGDSRAYLLNPAEKLRQLTRDHNLLWAAASFTDDEKTAMTDKFNNVSTREEYDALTGDEKWFYDEQNWVTQILGDPDLKYPRRYAYKIKKPRGLQPRITRERLMKGAKLVLLSDGVLVLTTEEIEENVKNPENPAKSLVSASLSRMTEDKDHFRSSRDDASALVVEVL